MYKQLLKYSLIVFLLFASKLAYGQIAIDSIAADSISCSSDSSGCVKIYVSGFTNSFNIQMSASTSFTVEGLTSSPVILCGIAPGNIGVIARDPNNGSLTIATHTVEANIPLDVTHSEDSVTCFGDTTGSIELNIKSGTGPFSVTWNTGSVISQPDTGTSILPNLSIGTYIYSVLDSSSGCTQGDTIVYEALDSIVPSFSVSSGCVGTPITFTNTTFRSGTGGSPTYSWSFPTGSPTNTNSEGPHDVTYFTDGTKNISMQINSENCSISYDTSITLQTPPSVTTISDTTICSGDTITLTTTGGLDYIWTPNQTISNLTVESPSVFPTSNTQYIVAGSDADGCYGRDTVNITVNDLPTLTLSEDTAICEGSSANLSASGANNYLWFPNENITSTNTQNTTVSPTVSTYYKVEGTNSNGCSTTDSLLITVNQAAIVSPSQDTTICFGDFALLKVTGTDSYSWTPISTLSSSTDSTVTATPTTTTTYKVVGTSVDGCVTEDSVKIIVAPLPIATVIGSDTICLGDSIKLTASGGSSYTWGNASSLTHPTSDITFAKPTKTTTYTVEVSNGICTDEASVTVYVLDNSLTSVSNDTVICSDNTVQLYASGGNTFSWAPVGTLNNPNIKNPIATPLVSTEYVVQISLNGQCFVFDTVNVIVNKTPKPITIGDTSICAGETIELFTSDGLNYTWSPSSSLENPNSATTKASPTTTTDYSVTIDNGNNCAVTETVKVTVNPAITANLIASHDTICFLDTLKLTASGSSNYTWFPNEIMESQGNSTNTAVPLKDTTITVLVEGVGGCNDTASVSVVVLTPPSLTTSNDTVICSGEVIQISASGGLDYQWIPNQNISNNKIASPFVFPEFNTHYVVRASTGGLCPAVDSVFVEVFERPNLGEVKDTTLCLGSSLNLNFTTPGTYNWSPNIEADFSTANQPIFSPTENRSYYLEFSDGNACVIYDTINIDVSAIPVAQIEGDTTICLGDALNLTSANSTTNYLWKIKNKTLAKTKNLSVSNLTKDTTITLDVINSFGCKSTDSVNISVFNFPEMGLPSDTIICGKDTVSINLSPTYNYSWSPNLDMDGSNPNNPSFFPTFTRQYIVTITDGVECSLKDTFLIETEAIPEATIIAADSSCFGDTILLIGKGGHDKVWDINGNPFTTDSISIVTTEDLIIKLTTTAANTCHNESLSFIEVGDSMGLEIVGLDSVCYGDEIFIKANTLNIDTLYWTNINQNSSVTDSIPFTLLSDSLITLTGFNEFGCSITMQKTLKVEQLPVFDILGNDSICIGDTSFLTTTEDYTYSWSGSTELSQTTNNNAIFFGSTTDTLTVSAQSNLGCSSLDSIIVFVSEYPTPFLPTTDSLCLGDSLTYVGLSSYTYSSTSVNQIQTTDSTFVFFPKTNQTLVLDISNDFGCKTQDSVQITVNDLPVILLEDSLFSCANVLDTIRASSVDAIAYTWLPQIGLSNPDSNVTAVDINTNQDFILQVTNNKGCINFDTITVTTVELPTLTTSPDTTICQGSTMPIFVSGGESYTWLTPTLVADINIGATTFIGNTTSILSVSGTQNGCVDTVSFEITVNESPEGILTTIDDSLCFNETLNANAKLSLGTNHPEGSFSFDNGATFSVSNNYNTIPQNDTTISVIFRDAFGCISAPVELDFVVFEALSLIIDTISFPKCVGPPGSFNVHSFTGGTAPYFYNFNSNDTLSISTDTLKFDNLTQGIYSFYIEDDQQCSERFNINFLSNIQFDTAITDVTCKSNNDGKISIYNITGGETPYTFGFDQNTTFVSDSTFDELSASVYSIYVKDNTGCIAQTTVIVEEPDSLIGNITSINDVTCLGLNDGEVVIEITGGTPKYTITGFDTVVTTNGHHTYKNLEGQNKTLVIKDNNNCVDSVLVSIKASQEYETSITQIGFGSCDSDFLAAKIDATTGGSGGNVYSLNSGATFESFTQTSYNLIGLNPGSYSIITNDTILGCKDTTDFNITSIDGLIVDSVQITSTPPSCSGNDGTLSITNLQGGTLPLHFSLHDSTFVHTTHTAQLDSTFTNLPQGKKGVLLIDSLGCEYQFLSTIPSVIPLEITQSVVDKNCGKNNGSISLNITGGSGSYSVGLDTTSINLGNTIVNLDSGLYKVYYYDNTNKRACLDSTYITIGNNSAELEIEVTNTTCSYDYNGYVTINNILYHSNDYTYSFSLDNDGNFQKDPIFSDLPPETYTIELKQENIGTKESCTYQATLHYDTVVSSSFSISSADTIKANITTTPDGKENENTGTFWTHSITGGTPPYEVSFQDSTAWVTYSSLDSLDTKFKNLSSGEYFTYIKDSNNCILEIIGTVSEEFNFPNIFTPNGDGLNDYLYIGNLPEASLLRVYDRWGALVYMMRNYDNSWDGNNQADGTYYYTLETSKYEINGWIQIVR